MEQVYRYCLLRSAAAGTALLFAAGIANATDGYFQDGYGARQKALAGAGAADGRDATTISLNPAGLVNVPNEASASISVNKADRSVSVTGAPPAPFPTPPPIFPVLAVGTAVDSATFQPAVSAAASYRLDAHTGGPFLDVVGVALYTNASVSTEYPAVGQPLCARLASTATAPQV